MENKHKRKSVVHRVHRLIVIFVPKAWQPESVITT